jgi:hypothetical protein
MVLFMLLLGGSAMAANLHRIQVFNQDGTYLFQFGSYGTGNGQFRNPLRLAADTAGNIYVADQLNQRVVVFNGTGAFLRNINVGVTPQSIAITGGRLYVWNNMTASGTATLFVFDLTGTLLLAKHFAADQYLSASTRITGFGLEMGAGNGYVMITMRVLRSTGRDDPLTEIHGLAFFNAAPPCGHIGIRSLDGGNYLALRALHATDSNYYVDQVTIRRRYTPVTTGSSVAATWSAPNACTALGADPDGNIYSTTQVYGSEPGSFGGSWVGSYAQYAGNTPQVTKYTAAGAQLAQWGALGSRSGEFGFITGVVCANGKVYVSDVNFYGGMLSTVYDELFGLEHHASATGAVVHRRARPGQALSAPDAMGVGVDAALTVELNGDLGAVVELADGSQVHRISHDDGRTWEDA